MRREKYQWSAPMKPFPFSWRNQLELIFIKEPSDTDRVIIDLVISVSESDLSLSLPLIHLSMSPAHWDQSERIDVQCGF